MSKYEVVIGLEVHAELSTQTKIFCGCPAAFGGDVNTHVCEVCLGMPGTLPSLNGRVVEYAVRAGLSTNCEITPKNIFDRKNYFYPDLPKAYQISQMYAPICRNGYVEIKSGEMTKKIGIHEIHMEEDAGKLIHDPWEDCTLVDYNRGGVPLIEIVSEPDFRSADDVIAYLEKLKAILQYLDVSDCKMQEGSMRADINLSVRPVDQKALGTRTEMKNMASHKAIARAIESETRRQIDLLEAGITVTQETRRWDDNKDRSFAMRSKEDAQDYKYFPDPDLMPVEIDAAYIKKIKDSLPEMPEQKKKRYTEVFGLPAYDADILTGSIHLVKVFEQVVSDGANPKDAANWIMTDVLKLLRDAQIEPWQMAFSPKALADIIAMVADGIINRNTGRSIFEKVFHGEVLDPVFYVEKHNLAQVSDEDAIAPAVKKVLDENPKAIAEYKGGHDKSLQFLIGQTMRALGGKADPKVVRDLICKQLDE